MGKKQYTAEQLADRWYDKRDVQNLVGKYVNSILLKREGTLFEKYWSGEPDVCLAFNDGYYKGREAVKGYYGAVAAQTAVKSKFIQALFPAELGDKSDEEIYGVGQLKVEPLTTPLIEIAGDGKTAKGLWHVLGSDNDVTAFGPLSYWSLGYLAVDFIKEGDDWKLWHVFNAEDIRCPMGENWVAPKEHRPAKGFEAIAELQKPAYTASAELYRLYSPDRPFQGPPELPESYETFAETFSYGA